MLGVAVTISAEHRPHGQGRPPSRREILARGRTLVRAIREGDESDIEAAVLALSRSRRVFAPLVFAVAAFVMLSQRAEAAVLQLRLTLVQVLPAMWIARRRGAYQGEGVPGLPRVGTGRRGRHRRRVLPQRGLCIRDLAARWLGDVNVPVVARQGTFYEAWVERIGSRVRTPIRNPPDPMYAEFEVHRTMIRDRVRTEAFRRAIDSVVRPGDIVSTSEREAAS